MSAINHSSVPSINHDESMQSRGNSERFGGGPLEQKHTDSVLMYCSYFTYCERNIHLRREMCQVNVEGILDNITKYAQAKKISDNSKSALHSFL